METRGSYCVKTTAKDSDSERVHEVRENEREMHCCLIVPLMVHHGILRLLVAAGHVFTLRTCMRSATILVSHVDGCIQNFSLVHVV